MEADWRGELDSWLEPFAAALRNKTRRRIGPAYIAGLIGPADRKSVQPMAARSDEVGYERLHHFVGGGVWDEAPLEASLLVEADRLVGGDDAWLIIDDTTLPKKGRHLVGVAPQYAPALGKNANCQTRVSGTLASREAPVMVGLRLFLPESWTRDAARLDRAGVPEELRPYRTKPEIALAQIDRVRAAGVRFGCVLADARYGLSAPFRQGPSERGLAWAVGIPFKQKVHNADVNMVFPVAARGRPRKNAIPDISSRPAQAMLETAPWRKVSWRRGAKGKLPARFAAVRVHVADGPPQRIHDMGAQHLPGASAAQACPEPVEGEELGLDHFEGRSWKGLHRHALMSMIALAFLQSLGLKQARGGKRISGPPPKPSLPAIRQAIIDRFTKPPDKPCPHCGLRPTDPSKPKSAKVGIEREDSRL